MGNDPDRLLQILGQASLSEIRSDQPDLPLRQFAVLRVVDPIDERPTVSEPAMH